MLTGLSLMTADQKQKIYDSHVDGRRIWRDRCRQIRQRLDPLVHMLAIGSIVMEDLVRLTRWATVSRKDCCWQIYGLHLAFLSRYGCRSF